MRSPRNKIRGCFGLVLIILATGAIHAPAAPRPTKVEGLAVWYIVPPDSIARKRAAPDELTAAHNQLPLGARVRVTHLANGKSVVVRITDRGIHDRRVLIDLCKEAAAQLDMLREGSARVRLEVLPDMKAPASKTNATL